MDRGLVVDLEYGRGEDLRLLASRHSGANVRFVGVDASADAVRAAAEARAADPRASLTCAALDGRLPFDDASVDLAYSHNLPAA